MIKNRRLKTLRAHYEKTASVCLDAILFTCSMMGAANIKHDGKIITCEYGGREIIAEYTIYPALSGVGSLVYFTTDMIDLMLAPPAAHNPSERKRDPAAEAAQMNEGEKVAA